MDFLQEYDFHLPEEQIAKFPLEKRDESRLLVVDRSQSKFWEAPLFRDITNLVRPGDVFVYNETKVSYRRVYLQVESGRIHESIFLEPEDETGNVWLCILKNRAKLKLADKLFPVGFREFEFSYKGAKEELSVLSSERSISDFDFEIFGNIPIPPYLKRNVTEEDKVRYQTIFANRSGSVAAPTAGLHFTDQLKKTLGSRGVEFLPVELQIGYGTFRPLTTEQWQTKTLHKENYSVPASTATKLNEARKENRRVIAVGTTTLRVLESVFDSQLKTYKVGVGQTDIFLSPGDDIQSVQGLITNFHLPKSSLLLLVSAFATTQLVLDSYRYALKNGFRFYSYGDSMFLF
ncbi:tRNA preQ1(34) S-adenosylmethionine ribosyltransferase-isomerase QueA [Leptospira congkakensis]|uniref:S-adenosylmethionine:tRNA ribosyltransferase-isomerase n=1 Tax=Leptospira congkakensis TaxID=2484932 RepID=A0A4Z1A9Z1_9LEPT|nr:tRNA preQ1(34) S-adenosylmethionine ribosyltransferase-isomerase QueA [Leptospira congkakensis]TGL88344.1 tRNA preQ1(34) S-adenosylmethionine ribosyltransferase-isomerase QueA [Leptospira congkakensis]TGL95449.1 tRNA preQ1(34) S-adenosylmethionine ribosyltransferase-isomerase QueA [Leptospira congkakensis]TGL96531.1 tRNA preQ1(34) S-adenosylmethionine ribosyltransferase-isomerase QueA [Leptospira congkakensis]